MVGHLVDVTSNYEEEKQQIGESFTAAHWIIKLLVGAIDPSYDKSDEEGHGVSSSSRIGGGNFRDDKRGSNMTMLVMALVMVMVGLLMNTTWSGFGGNRTRR